jgi:hypothetical protein
MKENQDFLRTLMIMTFTLTLSKAALGFCGFYVGKADGKLLNEASQVVLVRDEQKTVLTMVNDYKGSMSEFALVVPVPTVLERGQIHVTEKKHVDHLDAFTAPRLVEYFDPNPCDTRRIEGMRSGTGGSFSFQKAPSASRAKSLGVQIEAQYSVGEYDILILSAKESSGLVTWLTENKYNIPANAKSVLGSYIKQNLKFFVAKVNLKTQAQSGFAYLRPLQIAFDSPKFMLPIRLGTVNASGPQDLVIMALTRKGRVETTNYRTVSIPTDKNIPAYVRSDFGSVYKAIFADQVRREDMRAVFLEYAWDISSCDPCASEPLTSEELKELGVFWADEGLKVGSNRANSRILNMRTGTFVTRLHVRYTADKFPEDLVFQETTNRQNFQGRYILNIPFTGEMKCKAGKKYASTLKVRSHQEASNLANLTGWKYSDILDKMGIASDGKGDPQPGGSNGKWWEGIWKK